VSFLQAVPGNVKVFFNCILMQSPIQMRDPNMPLLDFYICVYLIVWINTLILAIHLIMI
jgi:hypothetical protein